MQALRCQYNIFCTPFHPQLPQEPHGTSATLYATPPPSPCHGGLRQIASTMAAYVATRSTSRRCSRELSHIWTHPLRPSSYRPCIRTTSTNTLWPHTLSVLAPTPVSTEYRCQRMVSFMLVQYYTIMHIICYARYIGIHAAKLVIGHFISCCKIINSDSPSAQ